MIKENNHPISWVEAGMILGIAAGLFDALRAIAGTSGSDLSAIGTLLIATFIVGAGGAIMLPLAFRLLAKFRPGSDRKDFFKTAIGEILLLFINSVLTVSLTGFFAGKLVMYLFSGFDPFVKAGIGFMATGIVMLVLVKAINNIKIKNIFVTGIIGIAYLIIVTGFWVFDRKEMLSAEIDTAIPELLEDINPINSNLPNILFIVMDTVRADHLSLYGYPKKTTPFLSELAKESTVYERAMSPAPWTLPSHASMFTGQFPSIHLATTEHRLLRPEYVTIAEILRQKGYSTVGFSSNPVVGKTHNLHQGFENFYEIPPNPSRRTPMKNLYIYQFQNRVFGKHKWKEERAVYTNKLLSEWLDEWQQERKVKPFFIFINYIEPHLPYVPPDSFKSQFLNEPLLPEIKKLCSRQWLHEAFRLMGLKGSLDSDGYRQLAALYDGEIAYLDTKIRELVMNLKQRGIFENTCLIITSDHGENLGEHDGLLDHCLSIHQTLLHVPLLIRYPPLFEKGIRNRSLVSIMSLFPTLLEIAKAQPSPEWPPAIGPLPRREDELGLKYSISEYSLPVFELSLLASEVHGVDIRPFSVRQRAIQDARWKYIWRSDGNSVLFDLSQDPGEEVPLEPSKFSQGQILRTELENWLANLKPPTFPPPKLLVPLDKKTRKLLKSLGYVR